MPGGGEGLGEIGGGGYDSCQVCGVVGVKMNSCWVCKIGGEEEMIGTAWIEGSFMGVCTNVRVNY